MSDDGAGGIEHGQWTQIDTNSDGKIDEPELLLYAARILRDRGVRRLETFIADFTATPNNP